jgi:hypothetical protein
MGPHLHKKIPELYGNRIFITVFTRDHQVLLQCQDGYRPPFRHTHTYKHTASVVLQDKLFFLKEGEIHIGYNRIKTKYTVIK